MSLARTVKPTLQKVTNKAKLDYITNDFVSVDGELDLCCDGQALAVSHVGAVLALVRRGPLVFGAPASRAPKQLRRL